MILEFKVENYLSFREEQILSFEPSSDKEYASHYLVEVKKGVSVLKLGLLYGANASGKTNILKSLEFLRKFVLQQKSDKTKKTGVLSFQFDESCIRKPSKFELSFYLNKIKYVYSVTINRNKVLEENLIYYPSTQPAIFFERKFDSKNEKSLVKFGGTINLKASDRKIIQGLTISNSSVFSAFSKANIDKSMLDDVFNWFNDDFMQIIKPSTDLFGWTTEKVEEDKVCKDFVLDVLKQADFNISSIDIEEEEIEIDKDIESKISRMDIPHEVKTKLLAKKILKAKDISFQHTTSLMKKNLPQSLESSGTLRYYGLGGVLNKLLSSNTFLCIDEIENSLHYDLVAHFIKTFLMNSKNSQLLFSTHDINLLNEDFLRRDTVWFLDKNEFGASELYSLLDFKLHKNLSPYNAYKIGKLGAKPNLGEIIISNHG
ncbi:ATP-binding protein [Tenacibaculum finnmarkense genomovar ulcerans]|uniref:AAA family ATPase n=1 Tax=Tenacibaculum finnmarkense TaxID=2781243 RepID=UPI001E4BF92E|nr:ATP-binding protein [Tenacibaculum finnmarkense]MCD8455225.1 ATP-binding protein [Tenacibaculum finnmarkense genomovar ulcerans]